MINQLKFVQYYLDTIRMCMIVKEVYDDKIIFRCGLRNLAVYLMKHEGYVASFEFAIPLSDADLDKIDSILKSTQLIPKLTEDEE